MSENITYMELNTSTSISCRFIFFLKNCLVVTGIIASGVTLGTVIVSTMLFGHIHKTYKLMFGYDENDYADIDGSDEEINIEFEEKYLEEYNELSEREIDSEELKLFKDKFLEEKTPKGVIKLSYDADIESFIYFAETKDLPYNFLETMGRAFVIQNNCKCIFVNIKHELDKANKQNEELKQKILLQEKQEEEKQEETTSVFARLKTYSSDASNKKNEIIVIPERSNHYIYKGNLKEYESLYLTVSVPDDFEHLDYNTFKKISSIDEKKTS